jgi:hypothetical protein
MVALRALIEYTIVCAIKLETQALNILVCCVCVFSYVFREKVSRRVGESRRVGKWEGLGTKF